MSDRNRCIVACVAFIACGTPEGLRRSDDAGTKVKVDFDHRPLPDIPLPNDLATRFDESSPTRLRINASLIAVTSHERRVRRHADELDGWGVYQPINIPFSGPLDVQSILAGHRDVDYDARNDVIYLLDVDPDSPELGSIHPLDLGNGNYPVVLENRDYWENDPRGWLISLPFEEADEDLDGDGVLDPGEDRNGNRLLDFGEDVNGNGKLDPPEDTDADGILDQPNYLPGATPARDDLAGRTDALMTFYEKQTHTLIARPMVPLRQRTTYAVVVTKRLLDAHGHPVGSPFEFVNHTAQTRALEKLPEVLPDGLTMEDVAFVFTYTTQSIDSDWVAVRDGLYGVGLQRHLGDDFPAEVDTLEPLRAPDSFPDHANLQILYTENLIELLEDLGDAIDVDADTPQFQVLIDSQKYVDYHVIGSYISPQLFEREAPDASGRWLPYDDQAWPANLTTQPVKTRPERVYFWLTVPRREVSQRGDGKPPPVVIVGHGYTSSRFEQLFYAGYFARQGIASIAIDCVSHGLELDPIRKAALEGQFERAGVAPFLSAVFKDRAYDQNADFLPDSGADFWTSYVFHTRDVVRQSALDYMQLVRIMKTFDGQNRWKFDGNQDGEPDLAGDFDGDGELDIGGDAPMGVTGGSLGGIMSMTLGALEPRIDVVVPIAGGGGLSDIGIRSRQGGVREAVGLRIMTPVYTGSMGTDGSFELATIVPDLNDDVRKVIARISGVAPGDTFVVENLINGKRGCGYVSTDGRARASVESDVGDATRISVYSGPALTGDELCTPLVYRQPVAVIDHLEERVTFQGQIFERGTPLVALAEGLALKRGTPSLRRFMGIAQLVLDPADPAVLARYLTEPLTYPGTGEVSGAHALIVTTVGDMNVPASSGVSVARAAGFVQYREPDARYGKSTNQVLIDTFTAEAVNDLGRYRGEGGRGIHLDIENFSQGTDMWGEEIPRLDPPLRAGLDREDRWGGRSGAIFPYAVPTGQHGFDLPGEMTFDARRRCTQRCEVPGTCNCDEYSPFDIGFFMFNVLGKYFASGGKEIDFDLCNSRDDCPGRLPPPEPRDPSELR
ncbi:MAG: hypothetical protein HYV07_18995 [Deltaproteobacteria bacterium]|nr:hypothetical protein [Deltaproteobacteria bacterium]